MRKSTSRHASSFSYLYPQCLFISKRFPLLLQYRHVHNIIPLPVKVHGLPRPPLLDQPQPLVDGNGAFVERVDRQPDAVQAGVAEPLVDEPPQRLAAVALVHVRAAERDADRAGAGLRRERSQHEKADGRPRCALALRHWLACPRALENGWLPRKDGCGGAGGSADGGRQVDERAEETSANKSRTSLPLCSRFRGVGRMSVVRHSIAGSLVMWS